MIKTSQIILDPKTLGSKHLIAIDIAEKYAYENGSKSNKLEGYNVKVVIPSMGFEPMNVVIPYLPSFTVDEPVGVVFKNLKLSIYIMNSIIHLKGIADSVDLVENKIKL